MNEDEDEELGVGGEEEKRDADGVHAMWFPVQESWPGFVFGAWHGHVIAGSVFSAGTCTQTGGAGAAAGTTAPSHV